MDHGGTGVGELTAHKQVDNIIIFMALPILFGNDPSMSLQALIESSS